MEIKDYVESAGKGLVIAFMVMLVSAAIYLALGREEQANRLAEIGYYFLVGGVILLLITLKGEDEDVEEKREKNMLFWVRKPVKKQYIIIGTIIMFLGVFILITTYSLQNNLGVYPGKPTLPAEYNIKATITRTLFLIGNLLLSIGSGLTGLFDFSLILLINTMMSILFKNTIIISLSLFILILYILHKKSTFALLILPLIYSVFIFTGKESLGGIGWSGLTFLLLYGIYAALPLTLILLIINEKNHMGSPEIISSNESFYKKNLILALFVLVAFMVAFTSLYLPHQKTDGGVVSLDTIFNIKMCNAYEAGEEKALWSWQRPLYTILACKLSGDTIENKVYFFDFYLPLTGFILLAFSSVYFLKKTGATWLSQAMVMPLSLFYWTPFFVYGGFQTNLIALPAGLFLMYKLQSTIEKSSLKNAFQLGISSLFLGLWHPWTLAYFSGSAFFLLLFELIRKRRFSILKKTIIPLIIGWIAHLFVSIKAGASGVASVALNLYQRQDFLWSIKYFVWGTALRGDFFFPVLITIIMMLAGLKKTYNTKWIVYSIMPALLALLTTNGKLYIRFMIDSPIPLLIGSTLIGVKTLQEKITTIMIIMTTFMTWSYYIYYAPLTPHTLPS